MTNRSYVFDTSRQNPPNPPRGELLGLGTANFFIFDGCDIGRVLADVIRLKKGNAEGLERNVKEALVKHVVSAP